jgi:hypothetical protein
MMAISDLKQNNTTSWGFIVIDYWQQSTERHVAPPIHFILNRSTCFTHLIDVYFVKSQPVGDDDNNILLAMISITGQRKTRMTWNSTSLFPPSH